jgi:arylformamidase
MVGTSRQITLSRTFLDLTHLISETMPVYPGEPAPQFLDIRTIQKDGVKVTEISIGSHTGTHVDAPCHFIAGTNGIDQIPLDRFIGEAVILDVSKVHAEGITDVDLEEQSDKIRSGDIVLLYTGTSDKWNNEIEGGGIQTNFSYLEPSAASWIVQHEIKCVGIDSYSIEKFGSKEGLAHKELLSKGVGVIENLNSNLKRFAGKRMFLMCMPLLLEGIDAAPARAILFEIIDNNGNSDGEHNLNRNGKTGRRGVAKK